MLFDLFWSSVSYVIVENPGSKISDPYLGVFSCISEKLRKQTSGGGLMVPFATPFMAQEVSGCFVALDPDIALDFITHGFDRQFLPIFARSKGYSWINENNNCVAKPIKYGKLVGGYYMRNNVYT